jgi:hypothetical protein
VGEPPRRGGELHCGGAWVCVGVRGEGVVARDLAVGIRSRKQNISSVAQLPRSTYSSNVVMEIVSVTYPRRPKTVSIPLEHG